MTAVLHPEWTAGRLEAPEWCPVPILQDRDEFKRFWRMVAGLRPRAILEIGAMYGGTLWHWAHLYRQGADPVRRIVSVDEIVPPADSRHVQVLECRRLWPGWMVGVEFFDVVGDSTDPAIVARVADHAPFDVVFVDGDHSDRVVRADWANYALMVRHGGIVAFHDSAGIATVTGLVDELRGDHFTVDFRAPSSDLGITAVFVP